MYHAAMATLMRIIGADAANGLIGPEYGFGLVVGSQLADQVLIIKYAHGGRSLAGDFRAVRIQAAQWGHAIPI